MKWSLIAHGSVAFRGSYDQCLDFAVERGLAETERRYARTGEPVDRVRLCEAIRFHVDCVEKDALTPTGGTDEH